ncbi:AzlD domain-containing protein [Streptococcus chenjunshii]|uniref:AzlD domain-containing protein n=1 Tax=Streptococcus chenjunshii TaxID=2173853 RepID=A0A372KPM3_9STRE|nr:AzlD domain-containing protein [Streptococcus chenjunshii]AXQ77919.1 AzlD domain-containing protein [Streptococcus chenjunshii]RFU51838.1 AzlD domain-containing protein [Streptococcus chenjunshii]RFU53926.1 AzlD domain-containing protein [Streptococcus chenjunshii]
MRADTYVLIVILLSGLVTWLPRIAPFILTKYKELPQFLIRFLNYLPVSIIFALTLSSVLTERTGSFPAVKWLEAAAVLPTFWAAVRYKNILLSVLVGVLCMACLRLIF